MNVTRGERVGIGIDIGGSGIRFDALDHEGNPSRFDSLGRIDPEGHPMQDRIIRSIGRRGIEAGAIVIGVDGPDIGGGIFRSFKTNETVNPHEISEALGGVPVETWNDVPLFAFGLQTAPDETVEVIKTGQEALEPGFTNRVTGVVTVSTGVGTAKRKVSLSGEISVDGQSGGHVDWGPDITDPREMAVYSAISHKARSEGYSPTVTVEQTISGGSILVIAEILEKAYYQWLISNYPEGTDFGPIIADDARNGSESAIAIQETRAGILAKAVRNIASADEAKVVALVGGSTQGLLPQLRDPEGLFQTRLEQTHPDHLYNEPTVVVITDELLAARGALVRAQVLMDRHRG